MVDSPSVTIVVPAFDEAEGIERTLRDLRLAAGEQPIIVVDDGSGDDTPQILARLKQELSLTVIRHRSNRGYGAALKTGIRAAETELVITFDGDGQHDPADIERLVERAEDADMVVGARQGRSGQPWLRGPGKWLLSAVANWLARMTLPDLNSGLRLFRRETILRYFHLLPDGFSLSTTSTLALIKDGCRVDWIEIQARPRTGASSVRQLRHGSQALLLVLRVVLLFDPLRVFMPAAILLFLGGAASAAYNIARSPAGLADADILLLLTGVLVFFFGLVSDQIAEMRRRGR